MKVQSPQSEEYEETFENYEFEWFNLIFKIKIVKN